MKVIKMSQTPVHMLHSKISDNLQKEVLKEINKDLYFRLNRFIHDRDSVRNIDTQINITMFINHESNKRR